MASDDTTTVLGEANTAAVAMMPSTRSDHDVTEVYGAVCRIGPIADLAAEAVQERNIDL